MCKCAVEVDAVRRLRTERGQLESAGAVMKELAVGVEAVRLRTWADTRLGVDLLARELKTVVRVLAHLAALGVHAHAVNVHAVFLESAGVRAVASVDKLAVDVLAVMWVRTRRDHGGRAGFKAIGVGEPANCNQTMNIIIIVDTYLVVDAVIRMT